MSFIKRIPPALYLLLIAILAYGIFFARLGFYWDELPMTWIYFRLGPEALAQYFSTNRPYWGMIYQITLPLFGANPILWQIFALILRWLSAVLLFNILRETFPKQTRFALIASTLFLVYPGFGQHFISMMYSHFYIVLNCFLLSLYLSLIAVRRPIFHLPALLFAFVNIMTMEYFYFLEFIRVVLFFIIYERSVKRASLPSIPYVILWISITLWRAFFFPYQTTNYKYVALEAIKASPLSGMGELVMNIGRSFGASVLHAWALIFQAPAEVGLVSGIILLIVILIASALTFFYFSRSLTTDDRSLNTDHWSMFLLAFTAWLLGGGQFWLVGLLPKITFNADRFNLSFMLGASLLFALIIDLLSIKPRVQIIMLILIIALSTGRQVQIANAFRQDWESMQSFFHQVHWRAPALEKGTTLLTNDLPVTYYSDNSLTGFLNWIYSPRGEMNTVLYFASVRTQEGRALDSGLGTNESFEQNYLATTFTGNTSKIVAINFDPPGCVRILDPEIDPLNKLIDPLLREVAPYSDRSLILAEGGNDLPGQIFGAEPAHGWCYYFELADRSRGDWESITAIGDQALALDDHPNDPVERFIFIEAYAHVGNWDAAFKQTKEAYRYSKEVMRPMLCALWDRLDLDLAGHLDSAEKIDQVRSDLQCP